MSTPCRLHQLLKISKADISETKRRLVRVPFAMFLNYTCTNFVKHGKKKKRNGECHLREKYTCKLGPINCTEQLDLLYMA